MPTFKVARTDTELQEAKDLVMRVYGRIGYIDHTSDPAKSAATIGKEGTITILAFVQDCAIGTVTIVPDNSEGLPMDIIYHEELSMYRATGQRLAEVFRFIVDTELLLDKNAATEKVPELDISIGLIGLAIQFGRQKSFDYLCFTLVPKHYPMYEALGCERIGEDKTYPSANNIIVAPYVLNLSRLEELSNAKKHGSFLLKKILKSEPAEHFFE